MNAPALAFLLATPPVLAQLLDFPTLDGQSVSYVEGTIALCTGQAILVSSFLVGQSGSCQSIPYPASGSYVYYGTL